MDLSGFKLPFRSQKRLLKGGLAETVALMNSILIGVILILRIGKGMGWLVVTAVFLLTFSLQVAFSKKDRNKKQEKNKTRAQTFRANVGAIIVNREGLVLALERKKIPGSWQFPQGGLDEGETPLEAVKREVREETGIEAVHLELLATTPRWLAYELPEEARSQKTGRGQVQKWFLFRFTGPEKVITMGDQKEFRAWEWVSMEELLPKVVAFKQPIYQELGEYFEEYLKDQP